MTMRLDWNWDIAPSPEISFLPWLDVTSVRDALPHELVDLLNDKLQRERWFQKARLVTPTFVEVVLNWWDDQLKPQFDIISSLSGWKIQIRTTIEDY